MACCTSYSVTCDLHELALVHDHRAPAHSHAMRVTVIDSDGGRAVGQTGSMRRHNTHADATHAPEESDPHGCRDCSIVYSRPGKRRDAQTCRFVAVEMGAVDAGGGDVVNNRKVTHITCARIIQTNGQILIVSESATLVEASYSPTKSTIWAIFAGVHGAAPSLTPTRQLA